MKPLRPVGPVLSVEAETAAVVAAIRSLNRDVHIIDRGAYVRVSAEGECVLTGTSVSQHLGRPFHIPADLEALMVSFQGRMKINGDSVRWIYEGTP